MAEPRQLAILRTYQDLVQVIRARRDELDVPHEIIDAIAGLTSGHTSKILCAPPMKHIGPVSWAILEVLGLRVVIEEDLQALSRAQRRSAWRTRRQNFKLPITKYPADAA
jgi:hypothetical protein